MLQKFQALSTKERLDAKNSELKAIRETKERINKLQTRAKELQKLYIDSSSVLLTDEFIFNGKKKLS